MNDTYTINVGRNDFRRWVLAIKDDKVIDRALAASKFRVPYVIKHFERKYENVDGVYIGLCFVDEFDYNLNIPKVEV